MTLLRYSIANDIGLITISNPPYNVLLDPVFEDEERLRNFLGLPQIKAVMISGEGRHFCHGADLSSLKRQAAAESPADFSLLLDKGKQLLGLISEATVPVVACIRGGCLGAGLELALSCHFRFASRTAMLGFPETSLRLMPGLGGTQVSLRTLGRARLIELILSARLINGEEALSSGLVDACAPQGEIEHKAMDFIRSLVADRPVSLIRSIMQSIHNSRLLPWQEALTRESELFFDMVRHGGNLFKEQ
jgi:enoyl-CoA hydratase